MRGIQEAGVTASVKHYIGNEQETNRNPNGNLSSVSSNIDDKTLHELYLWPFADAVHSGAGSVMCSYNRVDNSYACQNSKLMNGILKTELGFEGFVVSDWGAQRELSQWEKRDGTNWLQTLDYHQPKQAWILRCPARASGGLMEEVWSMQSRMAV